ncbi:conserved hypothetical protein [Vibrio jasicida]|nr:conserved hypothetical protein [Vibrio jasicida]
MGETIPANAMLRTPKRNFDELNIFIPTVRGSNTNSLSIKSSSDVNEA